MSVKAKVVALAHRPEGKPKESDFRIDEVELPALKNDQVLFRSLYISPDPYQRGRMYQMKEGSCVAEVLESTNPNYKPGDIIVPYKGWVSHGVLDASETERVIKHNPEHGPVSTALGVLGMPGMTAYFGLLKICQPQPGETVVVSGAAGAVGSLVGQIAKIKGAKVVGIAGTDEKCEYIKSLGFDYAINYKTCGPMKEALAKVIPEGVDCYFDNVGGEITDAVMLSLRNNARIAICGQISEYNSLDKPSTGPRLFWELIYKNALVQGFLCWKWASEWPEALNQMAEWIKEGKIKFHETIDEGGIEATPKAFINMLSGGNIGKQLVKL